MKFTLSWLKDHLDTEADVETISTALTNLGLEVESVTDRAKILEPFTVAHVIEAKPHPDADRLAIRASRLEPAYAAVLVLVGLLLALGLYPQPFVHYAQLATVGLWAGGTP